MVEEKKEESDEVVEETEEEDTTSSHIDRAEKAAIDMKSEREKLDKSIAEIKSLQADQAFRNKLGGQSEAGQQPPKEEEVSNIDYAHQALEGKFNEKQSS